jgi:hypothetical protein
VMARAHHHFAQKLSIGLHVVHDQDCRHSVVSFESRR